MNRETERSMLKIGLLFFVAIFIAVSLPACGNAQTQEEDLEPLKEEEFPGKIAFDHTDRQWYLNFKLISQKNSGIYPEMKDDYSVYIEKIMKYSFDIYYLTPEGKRADISAFRYPDSDVMTYQGSKKEGDFTDSELTISIINKNCLIGKAYWPDRGRTLRLTIYRGDQGCGHISK